MICTACGGTTFDSEGACLRCGTPAGASTVATLDSASTSALLDDVAAVPAGEASALDSLALPEPLPSTAPRNPPPAVSAADATQPSDVPDRVAPEPTPAPRRSSISVPIASPEDPSSTNPSRGTYCGRCGSAIDPAADFCGICGNPMNEGAMQRVRTARAPAPSMQVVGASMVMAAPLRPLHGSAPATAMRWLIPVAVVALVLIGLALSLLLAHHQ